jgi:hypothetical protein
MKIITLVVLSILFRGITFAQNVKFEFDLPPKSSGFKMDGYWIWGGSMIKVDSTYHLFAARWIQNSAFPSSYRTDSEIVRATSENPLGPFTFQEVVIGERDSTYWDANMAHNPTIHKIGDAYVLFYIGSDFTTIRENSNYLLRRVGYARSSSIMGPWSRSKKPVINAESNNPAILIDNGKIKLLYRDADLRMFMTGSETYQGPFRMLNDNVWPSCKLEDFYLFKSIEGYHFICEDNVGEVSGHVRYGVHLYSENGVDGWQKYDPVLVYDHTLHYEDGSALECTRRERPQLFIEDGQITYLLTGVYDGTNSWCQPVKLKKPILLE